MELEVRAMYTIDENGVLNNYPQETNMYPAEYPSLEKQRNYALQGAMAVLLITVLLLTTFAIS